MNGIRSLLSRIILLLVWICSSAFGPGSDTFHGSFMMSFKSSVEGSKDPPMLWNIESKPEGGRMVMEIQDDMQKKGVSKRVLFNSKDSLWIMMMEFNNVRQGARVHAAAMYRDTVKQQPVKMKQTATKCVIAGFKCKQIILESKKYRAEVWVTEEIKFDLGHIYELLSHCGMMSEFVRKGDWFTYKNLKGMVMEVTSTNKITSESYTMYITGIKPGEINHAFFSTKGFRISDIPEGQNCGVALEEK